MGHLDVERRTLDQQWPIPHTFHGLRLVGHPLPRSDRVPERSFELREAERLRRQGAPQPDAIQRFTHHTAALALDGVEDRRCEHRPATAAAQGIEQCPHITRAQTRARGIVHQDPIVRRRLIAKPFMTDSWRLAPPIAVRKRGSFSDAISAIPCVSPALSTTTMPAMRGSPNKERSDHSRTLAPMSDAYCLGNDPV